MKRFYSILKVVNPRTDNFAIVVCETQNDEKEIIAQAHNQMLDIYNGQGGYPDEPEGIFLNEFEL